MTNNIENDIVIAHGDWCLGLTQSGAGAVYPENIAKIEAIQQARRDELAQCPDRLIPTRPFSFDQPVDIEALAALVQPLEGDVYG